MNVGVRELRDGLSRYLADVRGGDEITVTDHGRPVARLVPINQGSPLERLIAEGRVTPPTNTSGRRKLPEPIKLRPGVTISDLVIEQRR
ncbi:MULTISPECIES: type II toxin-antitoxin system Phd/YefM family antitoxin [Microbacterium]|uniref:type II toxin-antitoxin system Phd/YefM family antitoxin n=1 Tax=Microbacterium TaxID=33882 RepID=UPI001F3E5326|nr:type II toxin-antitoxin system prevent-host-death family antitoxin [Microbacterium profundi]MCE7480660.1 type II toxin-antitoxin system prevent-host-death family antitoxin [Microbacterium profundi]